MHVAKIVVRSGKILNWNHFPLRVNIWDKIFLILLYGIAMCVCTLCLMSMLISYGFFGMPNFPLIGIRDLFQDVQVACMWFLWVSCTCMSVACTYMNSHVTCICLHVKILSVLGFRYSLCEDFLAWEAWENLKESAKGWSLF